MTRQKTSPLEPTSGRGAAHAPGAMRSQESPPVPAREILARHVAATDQQVGEARRRLEEVMAKNLASLRICLRSGEGTRRALVGPGGPIAACGCEESTRLRRGLEDVVALCDAIGGGEAAAVAVVARAALALELLP